MYALVDCVAFYASCEVIFRPDIRDRPVLVFSNNDSCCVTLNSKAKSLGFKKMKPYFELKPLIEQFNAVVFSSNYELYGDISNKVMKTLSSFSSDTSIYSIDEAWLDFTGHKNLRETGRNINSQVLAHTGIPTRVGFGTNKTLCKVASVIAKRVSRANGVCCIDDNGDQREAILNRFPISEVWGIGSKTDIKLRSIGVNTALELANFDKKAIRSLFGVTIERTARELNGEKCFDFHESNLDKQQIVVSKSFGVTINTLWPLQSITASYLEKALEKMRSNKLLLKQFCFSASTSRYKGEFKIIHKVITLPVFTNDTLSILPLLSKAIESCFIEADFVRAMVSLTSMNPESSFQPDLFNEGQNDKSRKLMVVIDRINKGNDKNIFLGRSPKAKEWEFRRKFKSPEYTTNWCDLVRVKC